MSEYFEAFVRQAEADWEEMERIASKVSIEQEIEYGYDMGYIPHKLRLLHITGRHWLGIIDSEWGPWFTERNCHAEGIERAELITSSVLYLRTHSALLTERELLINLELSFIPE